MTALLLTKTFIPAPSRFWPPVRRTPTPLTQTMSAQPALVSRATFTKEKIALLCLMNMVFERHSQDRNIPFEEIAARTKLPVDQVGACPRFYDLD